MKNLNNHLYLAITYFICAIAFLMLAFSSRMLYIIVAILFIIPSGYHCYKYVKEMKNIK